MSPESLSFTRRAGLKTLAHVAASSVIALTCMGTSAVRAGEAMPAEAPVQPALHLWWSAFHDPTLDLLLADGLLEAQADRERLLALQARAASLYLKVRVYSVRLHTARRMRETIERQFALLQQDGQADSDLRVTTGLLREMAERERRFTALRSESAAALAETLHGRHPSRVVALLLEPVLEDWRLPVAEYEVPKAISGLVLRQRPDVMTAEAGLVLSGRGSATEQLRLAKYLQALSEAIQPEDAAAPMPAPDSAGALETVLRRARGEIATRLVEVTARGEAAGAQVENVQRLSGRLDAAWREVAAGHVSEVVVLSGLLNLLQEQDQLAVSVGLAGLAWVELQRSMGGAGQARTSELLGTVPVED